MAKNFNNRFPIEGNPILQISAHDLKEVMKYFYEEEKQRIEKALREDQERATLSRKEVAKLLGVTMSTLWHWAKVGYLVPVKIGSKVMYRPGDIDRLLTKNLQK